MAIDRTNILIGPVDVWLAATGEALPEIDDLSPPTITVTPSGSWSQVEGFASVQTFRYAPEINLIRAQEHAAPIKGALAGEEVYFSVRILETDFTNLDNALPADAIATVSAAADQTAQDQLKVGSGTLTETAVLLVGSSPEGGSRLIHIPYALHTEPLELNFERGTESGFLMGFTGLADVSATAGEDLWQGYDITAAATT